MSNSSKYMGSFRPEISQDHNRGRNPSIPMDLSQQQQHRPNAVTVHQLLGNARSPPGFCLPGPGASPYTYASGSHNYYNPQQETAPFAVSSSNEGNSPHLPRLHGPDPFQSLHRVPPLYTQVTPNLNPGRANNTSERVGSNNQLIHNSHKASAVDQPDREEEPKATEDLQAPSDRFGMQGFMEVLSGRNPNVTALAVGRDRETFDSYDNVYCTYNFPWSSRPSNPEPQYKLPQYYLGQVPRVDAHIVSGLKLETLLFMFYSAPNDEAQLLAANELYERSWVYHKQLRVWLKPLASEQLPMKTNMCERGCYAYFDPHKWSFDRKDDFTLFYHMVESRPCP